MNVSINWIETKDCVPDEDDTKLVTCETKTGRRYLNRAYYCKSTKSWHGSGSMSKVIAWADIQPFEDGGVKE